MHASNSIIRFADDTIVVGLISNNDETTYKVELRNLAEWCQENNLSLKEADRGLQESAEGAPPYPHRWDCSREGEKLQVPWHTHH
jgi:hypothetical protein